MAVKFIVHTDGAAKGNPGPSGIGVALYRDGETKPLAVLHEYIGETTNNVAEYRALIRGLSEALLRGADRVEARTDSELMARQIAGRYKVNNASLIPLHTEARQLLSRFADARVVHIPREQNALADKLANQGVAAGRSPRISAPSTSQEPPRFKHSHSDIYEGEQHFWNVERLWAEAKDLPLKKVPVADLASYLDTDCWFNGKAPTMRQVADHARRIYEVDFSKPVILSSQGRLMDGGHRLARAYLLGLTEIDAVQFERNPEPDFRRPAP